MSRRSSKKPTFPLKQTIRAVIILVAAAALVWSSQPLIRVAAQVDKSVITIGDRITYTLTITHHKNLSIEKPGPGANLGQFEIKDYRIYDPVRKDDLVTEKFEYSISVFDTGKFVIPPFPVAFTTSDTSRKYQIIKSEPIEIYVKSVLTAQDATLKDIKPPVSIPFDYWYWVWRGIVLLLLIAAGLAALYIIRRRKAGKPLFRKEVIRPAHEIALEALTELKSRWRDMLANGEHKALFTEISDILRKYLENRFFIQAMEETTYEIRHSLQEMELEEEAQQRVIQVLELADQVKFAKYIPGETETEHCLGLLEDFINETKLVFEAVEQEVEVGEEAAPASAEAVVSEEK